MKVMLTEGERAALDVVLMQIDPRFEDHQDYRDRGYQIAFNILSLRPDIKASFASAVKKMMSDPKCDINNIIDEYDLNYGLEHETARETIRRTLVEPFEKAGLL